MITILDYGVGNLRSGEKALQYIGEETQMTADPAQVRQAEKLLLPGVGNFGEAMQRLREKELEPAIAEAVASGTPLLGICPGMQMLFEESEESPGVPGLGLLKGKVCRIPDAPDRKVPHMGWNSLHLQHEGRLFAGIPEDSYVYFIHSYYLQADDEFIVKATAEYGVTIHASVEQGAVFGMQYHPEKSAEAGLQMLRNFAAIRGGA